MAEDEEDLDASSDEDKYVVEAILSEGMIEESGGSEVWMYLVKWEHYEMHECTWEPGDHFEGTDLLKEWDKKKEEQGPAFQQWMLKNEKEYNNAMRRWEEQQNEGEANPSVSGDDHQNDEDASLQLPHLESGQQAMSPARALARREATDESQLNSLFIGSQDVPSPDPAPKGRPEGGLFFRQTPVPRRPPLQQSGSSSSSSSEEEADEAAGLSDDSLMGELQQGAKKPRRKSTTGPSPRNDRQTPRKPVQLPRSPTKKTKSGSNATKVAIQSEPEAPRKKDLSNILDTVEIPAREQGNLRLKSKAIRSMDKHTRQSEATFQTTSSTQRTTDNVGPSILTGGTPATKTVTTSAPRLMQMKPPATSALPSSKDNTSGPKTQAIKFVNQPKPKPRQWKDGEKPFKTLHARHIAQQRSRIEGTPELGALTFPAGPPQGLPKAKTQATGDDLYGRREARPRRFREHDMDDDDDLRRALIDSEGPLKDWEVGKVPQVCPNFRLSNDCKFGARKCYYLHRNKDPEGRDYPVGDVHSWIPPKFRAPPVTCPYWIGLWGTVGCDKPENECTYAHHNTGYAPQSQVNREVLTRIDTELRPQTESRRPSQPEVHYNKRKHPSELTCWYWAHGDICRLPAEKCKFRHYDTGTVAELPHNLSRNFVPHSRGNEGSQYTRSHEMTELSHPPISDEHDSAEVGDMTQLGMEDVPVGLPPQTPTEHRQSPPLVLPPPPPAIQTPATQGCSGLSMTIEKTCKFNFMDMFVSNENGNKLVDKKAFLIYHPADHAEALDVTTRWLLMQHVEVGSPWYDGSWDDFKRHVTKGGSGVIIAHPDFDYFTELPGFGKVLQNQVRLWSIGVQEGIEFDAAVSTSPAELRYDRIEIFPLGGFIYITEDVFERQSQLALSIVEAFLAKIETLQRHEGPNTPWHKVADAALLWRLCVRPELMDYLIQNCEKNVKGLEAGDPDMRSCAELYTLLSDTNYIDQDTPTSPLSPIPDKYPILSERRIIAETQPVDYFNAVKRSQEDANLRMIRYFAGLQIDLRRDYRHYYVVHTEPLATCAQQWKQEIQTISEVISPEKCLEELKKESSESLFDFYEKHMPVRG